jgi:hypothetical protein
MEGNAVGRALENIATQNAVRSPDYQSTGASFFSSSNQFMPMGKLSCKIVHARNILISLFGNFRKN